VAALRSFSPLGAMTIGIRKYAIPSIDPLPLLKRKKHDGGDGVSRMLMRHVLQLIGAAS